MECSINLHHSPVYNFSITRTHATKDLHISCETVEPHEPFKLSTLSSPLVKLHDKSKMQSLFECCSPSPRKPKHACSPHRTRNLDLFLDAALRKRENFLGESTDDLLGEYKLNFSKQAHRVKYFWRGTSLARPFTFMRVRAGCERIACEEDYSLKKANPNDELFN